MTGRDKEPYQKEENYFPFPKPKPLEMKLAEAIFLKMRNNMILVKALSNPNVHYSAFVIGSKIDLHITLEKDVDSKKKHIQLIELQLDWKFLIMRMAQDLQSNMGAILTKTEVNDPEWQDMEIEVMPPEMLLFSLQNAARKNRWNIDYSFFDKLEASFQYAKLKELVGQGFVLGWSSEGHLIISNGNDCWIFDLGKLTKIMSKNLESSIRKIRLRYFTFRLLLWWLKIQLLNLNRRVIDYLGKIQR